MYPLTAGKSFDHVYYEGKHCPMVRERLASHGLIRLDILNGVSGMAPGSDPGYVVIANLYFQTVEEFQQGMTDHGAEILADIPNYTPIDPQMLVSQVV